MKIGYARCSTADQNLDWQIDALKEEGCEKTFQEKESWLDTTTPQGKLLFTIFAGVSQFERDLTYQRTMDGLSAARARGRLGGRPKKEKARIQNRG